MPIVGSVERLDEGKNRGGGLSTGRKKEIKEGGKDFVDDNKYLW